MSRRTAAFSLVEVALALAIFAAVALGLIALLGTGLKVSREAIDDAETSALVENVQARLTLDPAWPGDLQTRWFNQAGEETSDQTSASFRLEFTRVTGPGFTSDYLDTYRVAIQRLPQKISTGLWTLQRARLAAGQPLPAS